MNKLFNNLSLKELLSEVMPSFGVSLLVAESFYKLGSFTLECLAFLASWYFFGILINKLKKITK